MTAPAVALQTPGEIAELLGTMSGRPFGVDEEGRRIDHGTGRLVAGPIEWMEEYVEAQTLRSAPTNLGPAERAGRGRAARATAVDELVRRLNAAIPDVRYHVTESYLRNDGNTYSYEFRLFVAELCRAISGDPRFFFHVGPRLIPGALGLMSRPMGTRGTYAVLPRLVAKVVKTDMRVIATDEQSATVQWNAADQLELVPPRLHERYVRYACETYRGAFANVPLFTGFAVPAEVESTRCQAEGDDVCEWVFRWEPEARVHHLHWVLGGIAGSVALVAAATRPRARLPLAALATLGPAVSGLLVARAAAARASRDEVARRLEEHQQLAESEYDENLRANAALQSANVELRMRVSELTALHELSIATQATLNLDEVLQNSLSALIGHLSYDRALVMLVDEERRVLTRGRAIGARPEEARLVDGLEVHLDHPDAVFGQLLRADGAVLYRDLDQSEHEPTRTIARSLNATTFLGTPLITKGERVGVLVVDNGRSARPIAERERELLFAVGSQIAGAIGSARLYEAVEQQNRSLQREVRELRIEIDETRKSQQVAAITDSDYFRGLREQAIELREALGASAAER